jgi:hypothetical protein
VAKGISEENRIQTVAAKEREGLMGQASQSERRREWPFLGWIVFVGLNGGCLFTWAYVLAGHISGFQRVWSFPSTYFRIMWVTAPLTGLFFLLPSMGLTRFGREIVILWMCWGLFYALLGLIHFLIPPAVLYVLLLVAPIAVQGASVAVLVRSRRRA